jgi:hypothetical protein
LGIEDKPERREVTAAVVSKELKLFARARWPLANDKSRKQMLRRLLEVTERRIKSSTARKWMRSARHLFLQGAELALAAETLAPEIKDDPKPPSPTSSSSQPRQPNHSDD